MSIQTIVHEPSGEVIIILTRTDGTPKPLRLNRIRGIWPGNDAGKTTVEVGQYGYVITDSIKELYGLLTKHECTGAYWGPDDSNDWPSWVTSKEEG